MPTHRITTKYESAGKIVAEMASEQTEEIELEYEETIAGGAAEVVLAFAIADTAKVKAVLFAATGAAVQISTDDAWTGTPQDTFAIPAGGIFRWSAADPLNKAGTLVVPIGTIFSAAVDTIHVKNTSGSVAATVYIRLLLST